MFKCNNEQLKLFDEKYVVVFNCYAREKKVQRLHRDLIAVEIMMQDEGEATHT